MCYVNMLFAKEFKRKIVSVAMCPGSLKTDLARYASPIRQKIYGILMVGPIRGGCAEIYSAVSPDITIENSGCFAKPSWTVGLWANFMQEGLENGTADKIVNWCKEKTDPFYKG